MIRTDPKEELGDFAALADRAQRARPSRAPVVVHQADDTDPRFAPFRAARRILVDSRPATVTFSRPSYRAPGLDELRSTAPPRSVQRRADEAAAIIGSLAASTACGAYAATGAWPSWWLWIVHKPVPEPYAHYAAELRRRATR